MSDKDNVFCIGASLIKILAKDGQWQSESGGGLVAADDLFHRDPYDRVAALESELAKVTAERERFRVQLAGCGVAALGGISGGNLCKKGDFGWSPSYQDVVNLRVKYEELRVRSATPALMWKTGPVPEDGLYLTQCIHPMRPIKTESLLKGDCDHSAFHWAGPIRIEEPPCNP